MVAKAMAKQDVSAADKALIDKLAAEFATELDSLGVRVANLERNADKVKFTGSCAGSMTASATSTTIRGIRLLTRRRIAMAAMETM